MNAAAALAGAAEHTANGAAGTVSQTKLIPFDDNVVIEPLKAQTKSRLGLHLSEHALQGPTKFGRVIACGPGKVNTEGGRDPMPVAVGDEVVYSRSLEVQPDGIEGPTLVICPAGAVLAKIER